MSDNIMQMSEESTIRGYIENYAIDEVTQETLNFHQVLSESDGKKMVVNETSLLQRYMPEISSVKERHTLTESEYKKYRFNPKRLSYDLYGTTELWSLLLDINDVASAVEFDLRTVYLLPTYIVNRIERILNLESANRNYNAEQVSAELLT